jgi:hypothetical protein
MKSIEVRESVWGPRWLLNPENGKMCCIGQAAEQCGADRSALSGRSMMPSPELHLDDRMQLGASNAVYQSITELTIGAGAPHLWLLKNCIGYLNDHYHFYADDDPRRKKIKAALKVAFADAGYELTFTK